MKALLPRLVAQGSGHALIEASATAAKDMSQGTVPVRIPENRTLCSVCRLSAAQAKCCRCMVFDPALAAKGGNVRDW